MNFQVQYNNWALGKCTAKIKDYPALATIKGSGEVAKGQTINLRLH